VAKRITPRFLLGLEYNATVGEWTPTANWTLLPETDTLPLINLGTSSDRIFSPPGKQSYYVTFAKGIASTPLSPWASLSYSEWEERLLFAFGCNVSLSPSWDFMPMLDGRNTHLLLTYRAENKNISLLLVKMRYPGISVGFGF